MKLKEFENKGFTLIELLLYIGIAATIAFIVSLTLSFLYQSRLKNQTIAEVEQNGAQVMEIITQTIRNADNITSPAQGATAGVLNLNVIDALKNPTIFDLSGTTIRIKEGSASYVPLTSTRVTAPNLSFYNLSRTNTPGTLRIQFTLTHVNPGGRNEYNYSKTFYGTASLR